MTTNFPPVMKPNPYAPGFKFWPPISRLTSLSKYPWYFSRMPVEYPELSTSPARTYRSSAKCTPPVLRSCAGATWPRKKTRSGKIFGVMSAALRTDSLPSAGELSALATRRCRRGKLISSSGSKIKNLAKRAMETPFKFHESYNIFCTGGKQVVGPSPSGRPPGNWWGWSPLLIDLTPDTGFHSRLPLAVMAHFYGSPLSRPHGLFRAVHNRAQPDCQVGPTIA